MGDDPGHPVEFLIRRLVGAPESLLWNLRQLLASLWPLTTSLTLCSFVPVACDMGAARERCPGLSYYPSSQFKGTLDHRPLLSVPRQPPILEISLELKLEF